MNQLSPKFEAVSTRNVHSQQKAAPGNASQKARRVLALANASIDLAEFVRACHQSRHARLHHCLMEDEPRRVW